MKSSYPYLADSLPTRSEIQEGLDQVAERAISSDPLQLDSATERTRKLLLEALLAVGQIPELKTGLAAGAETFKAQCMSTLAQLNTQPSSASSGSGFWIRRGRWCVLIELNVEHVCLKQLKYAMLLQKGWL